MACRSEANVPIPRPSGQPTAVSAQTGGLRQRLPLYLGGFLGPFATMVVLPAFPELRETFGVSTSAVGWSFSAYLLPFGLLLTMSGTIGERYGRRRVTRTGYLLFVAASLLCAMAPTFPIFLFGRVLQGIANALVTPLLLAGLAEMTKSNRLGHAIGIYTSYQSAGTALGPLAGGLAAQANWRISFVITAAISVFLATVPPVGEPRTGINRPPIRPLLRVPVIALGASALFSVLGPTGADVLLGIKARDLLGMSPSSAGTLLLVGSAAGVATSPMWGRLLDTVGLRMVGVAALVVGSLGVVVLGPANSSAQLGVIWIVVTSMTAAGRVVIQTLAPRLAPENRGGVLSLVLSGRFIGFSIAPLVWIPVFERSPSTAFTAMGAMGVLSLIALLIASMRLAAPAKPPPR